MQVRCGSVYVTAEDSAQKVTQTVVTATSVAEKKRRASKYTVAVGTSHGHGQSPCCLVTVVLLVVALI